MSKLTVKQLAQSHGMVNCEECKNRAAYKTFEGRDVCNDCYTKLEGKQDD